MDPNVTPLSAFSKGIVQCPWANLNPKPGIYQDYL